jgi:cyclopropane fatty-acyl-phospholipid synthase-like methyltransferase
MINTLRLKDFWNREYESTATPFDVEEPDEWIATLAMQGRIRGNVLDAGCGPGRTTRYLASRGYGVLGVDISANAIERAVRKAAGTGNKAHFLHADMCQLSGYERQFDTVIDIGCFHSLDEDDRGTYAACLHRLCRPGAAVYLRAFSASNPREWHTSGNRHVPAVSSEEIRAAFSANGWAVNEIVEDTVELFISPTEKPRTNCWFAEMHYI